MNEKIYFRQYNDLILSCNSGGSLYFVEANEWPWTGSPEDHEQVDPKTGEILYPFEGAKQWQDLTWEKLIHEGSHLQLKDVLFEALAEDWLRCRVGRQTPAASNQSPSHLSRGRSSEGRTTTAGGGEGEEV